MPEQRKRPRHQPPRQKIINRSNWPDHFVDVVVPWILRRAYPDRPRGYTVTLPAFRNCNTWAGTATRHDQRTRINRRFTFHAGFPFETSYRKYANMPVVTIRCRLETFVLIVAHEAAHGPVHYKHADGTRDQRTIEEKCELIARQTVAAFREAWPNEIRPAIRKRILAAKARRARKAARKGPDAKLAQAEALLAKWETKLKMAKTKVAKYRRQARAQERRIAASTGPNKTNEKT